MPLDAAYADVERRKQVKILLRRDLSVTEQRYEGKAYWVVKDPVSLRYYRFKEQERFLLGLMDGRHTLEDAQKAFEQRFRPERLTLEDLEVFASQLLQSGLAQNDSPSAGKQLYDRLKKRKRTALLQAFTNILYIKIPLFDPDATLRRLAPSFGFIFTLGWLAVSVCVMVAALGLVATQWNAFVARLPTFHEFFSFHTLLYMWVALGLVKIIHEFGHGLSCKTFGGEVHEMGLLFLCFSPCLYCNVSDAWTMPSKWKRIVISAAGIYVELMIAAMATFVWWSTDSGTFINRLSMSLMTVCSISTIIFNGNPLMRFDGYYVLADWIEIPNLRDRANRYLQNLAMEHCLGIETQPEPYMSTGRKCLFVFYAVASYLYRWFITFAILYFMYTFLKPYKLGAISFILGTGALASMIGYPFYRLIRGVRRRGRLPDMKPVRVTVSAAVVAAAVALVLFIPFPVSVYGLAVVQVEPAKIKPVVVPEKGGFLEEILVADGAPVKAGDPIARLRQPDSDIKLELNQIGQAFRQSQRAALIAGMQISGASAAALAHELRTVSAEIERLRQEEKFLRDEQKLLILRAPCDGKVMKLLEIEQKGRFLEKGQVVCEVGDDAALCAILLVPPSERSLIAPGKKAWLFVKGVGITETAGYVREISAVEAKDNIHPALTVKAGGEIPTVQDPQTGIETPEMQHYQVMVGFDRLTPVVHPGVRGRVKIEAGSETLWWRFRRYLATTFNWGL